MYTLGDNWPRPKTNGRGEGEYGKGTKSTDLTLQATICAKLSNLPLQISKQIPKNYNAPKHIFVYSKFIDSRWHNFHIKSFKSWCVEKCISTVFRCIHHCERNAIQIKRKSRIGIHDLDDFVFVVGRSEMKKIDFERKTKLQSCNRQTIAITMQTKKLNQPFHRIKLFYNQSDLRRYLSDLFGYDWLQFMNPFLFNILN
jgi:hypothetical protein